MEENTAPQPEFDEVFTAYITLKSGKRIYAAAYGLKAFCLRIRRTPGRDK